MFNDYKKDILYLANTEAGRFLLSKLGQKPEFPIVDIGKDYFIEDTGERTKDRKIYRATFYHRVPIKHLFVPILEKIYIANDYKKVDKYSAFLHYSDLERNKKYPQIYLMSSPETFNPDADPETNTVDGDVLRNVAGESFGAIRTGAGTAADDSNTSFKIGDLEAAASTDTYSQLARGILLFNTAPLPDGINISDVSLILRIAAIGPSPFTITPASYGVVISNPASNTALVAADYNTVSMAKKSSYVDQSSMSVGSDSTWTFTQAGRDYINLTGITKLATAISYDIDNSAPNWEASDKRSVVTANSAEAGSNIPRLVVTYTLPGGIFFGSNF